MQPDSEPEVTDTTLAGEIRLLEDLMLAASGVTRHLTQDEVDRVLNQNPPVSDAPSTSRL